MGRGRAKAKQTKVARQLKYSSGGTDLEALRKELTSGSPSSAMTVSSATGDDDTLDDEGDYDADDDSDDDGADDDDTEGFGSYGARG